MATGRHPKRRLSAKARPTQRLSKSKARRAEKSELPLARAVVASIVHTGKARAAHQKLGNPLAISRPTSLVPFEQAKRILILRRQQHLLWSWAVALSLVLVFATSIQELPPTFNLAPPLPEKTALFLETAGLLSFLVVGLEIFGHYRQTSNKMLFLRQNALTILAILPIGFLATAGRAVESLGALRSLQMAGKLDELSVLLPRLNVAAMTGAVSMPVGLTVQFHNLASRLGGVFDFFELMAESFARLLP